ncbi:hypothetical protein PFISCL1PPCAC_12176, partial [Pristionchus fissidentatus]
LEMYLLLSLIVLFGPLTAAIICLDTESGSCCGDLCYTELDSYNGKLEVVKEGCLRGKIFTPHFWNDNSNAYNICGGSDYCNLMPWSAFGDLGKGQGTLTCAGTIKGCFACERKNFNVGEVDSVSGCRSYKSMSIDIVMLPDSCVRFQNSKTEDYVQCVCDSGNNCDKKLMKKQQLQSDAVTCYMGTNGTDTCKGAHCYIHKRNHAIEHRGCITNNEQLLPRLYRSTYFTFEDSEYVVC